MHVPAWQVSVRVQALPSSQVAPLGFAGLEHVPVAGSQVPATWHWSAAAQTTGLAPVHVPAWQVSVCVQALPSLQEAPSGLVGLEQRPVVGSHTPAAWHWPAAAQVTGVCVQAAGEQAAIVHGVPSSQLAPANAIAVCEVWSAARRSGGGLRPMRAAGQS